MNAEPYAVRYRPNKCDKH